MHGRVASLRRATWSTHARISRTGRTSWSRVGRTDPPLGPLARPSQSWLNLVSNTVKGSTNGYLGRGPRVEVSPPTPPDFSATGITARPPAPHFAPIIIPRTYDRCRPPTRPHVRTSTGPRPSGPVLATLAKIRNSRTLSEPRLGWPPKPMRVCLSLSARLTPCRHDACPRTLRTRLHQPRPPALASPRLCRGLALLSPRWSPRRPHATL